MSKIQDALRYPTEHDDWQRTLLIGGVLSVFSFLLVPILPVYGYVVRVIRHRLDDDPAPPLFDNWEELFTDGIRAFAIVIAYLLVPGIIGAITVGGSLATISTGTAGSTATGFAGLFVGGLFTLVLVLVFGYVAAAGLVNFADEGTMGAAFDVAVIRRIVLTGEYAVAWGLSVLVFIAAGVVSGALNVIPFLGAIIGAFVLFYAQVVSAYLWAGGVSDARDGGDITERPGVGESTV